jgi:hypothetical protein
MVVRPTVSFAPIALRLPGGLVLEVADPAAASPEWIAAVAAGILRAMS